LTQTSKRLHGTAIRQRNKTLVTDKLASYPAARRRVMPGVEHRRSKYLNNRVENSRNPRGSANGR
jgi:putative transposase